MRWLMGFVLLLSLLLFGGYVFLKGYPYRLYSNWIQGSGWNSYYSISNYRPDLLKPTELDPIPPYKEDYVQLWKPFPLRNSLIPLPTRHPLFITVPVIEFTNSSRPPQVGMSIIASNGRELSRVYTLPTALTQDHTHGQELFKLPFVKNKILKKDQNQVWKDIFTHEIKNDSKNMDDMIHDLYILHLRSKLLPPETIKYGLLKDEKAIIELVSKDKDYIVELVMTQEAGSIYSYVLKTEKRSDESRKLRSKFLESIAFQPIDSAMGRLIYTEFKQLNFARQVDQEGMLYLFSAWTQEVESQELLKEIIFYLERGRNTGKQLKTMYKYALKKYGKTFTTRNIFTESDDPELALSRKIEIEEIESREKAKRAKIIVPEGENLTPEERMNMYLKKAKQSGPVQTKDMTIH
jgi:hypothetical protein